MKLAVFKHNGGRRIGIGPKSSSDVFIDTVVASERLKPGSSDLPRDMVSLLWSSSEPYGQYAQLKQAINGNDPALAEAQVDIKRLKLEAPLARPGKIICLAGNYREHIIESGFAAPQASALITQQLFLKPSSSIIGDGDDIMISSVNDTVGWETELAVVIGKRGRNIPAENAYEHVFGYTILNDVSERRLNSRIENRTKRELDGFFDWLAGKWFDGFAPSGPWIVTADEIIDPHNLEITLKVNGQTRQHGNTAEMIFRIPEQISYISSIMTLEPGDLISTGTPVGAGVGGDASLHDGDEMVCEIEGIGKLRNKVRAGN
ncbi:MAG TPA: fumarylacetoacetate hydrolase family protein [Pyrinomonadaceae bacterium]|jgi:2-keto-4-pentenoate hydratase/2-oxohepta-3-ene-1,7-dioic acid hydratase in catechol pathway